MTPTEIEVLIHCHVSPLPHPRESVEAVRDALQWLEANELIEPESSPGGGFMTTARGRAHVAQLCQTPYPELGWVGANGQLINAENLS